MRAIIDKFVRQFPAGQLTIIYDSGFFIVEAKAGINGVRLENRSLDTALSMCMDQVKLWR